MTEEVTGLIIDAQRLYPFKDGRMVVIGYLVHDEKNRFADNSFIRTSQVMFEDEGRIHTFNSIYEVEWQ